MCLQWLHRIYEEQIGVVIYLPFPCLIFVERAVKFDQTVLQADSLAEYFLETERYRYFMGALEGIHDHVDDLLADLA